MCDGRFLRLTDEPWFLPPCRGVSLELSAVGGEATLHLCGRFAIHKNRGVGVHAENGGRAGRSDWVFECPQDDIRLTSAEHRQDQLRNTKQRRYGDRDGTLGNFVHGLKPAFGCLLAAAGLVEVNDLDVERI